MFEFLAFFPPTNPRLPIHSPSALTEHVSMNLARFLSAARNEHADLQVHFVLLPVKRLKEAFSGQKSTETWIIEATDFRIEVRSDLQGH